MRRSRSSSGAALTQRRTAMVTLALATAALAGAALALPGSAAAFGARQIATGVSITSLVRGPDGRMWFTGSGVVGRIGAGGHVSRLKRYSPADGDPAGITDGPDGNVWFVDDQARFVGRATASGGVRTFTTGLPPGTAFGSSIVAGADGALWFTAGDRLGRMTTGGGLQWFRSPVALSYDRSNLVAGPDGRLWIGGVGRIYAVRPDGTAQGYALPFTGDAFHATRLAVDPRGFLWVADDKAVSLVTTAGVARLVSAGGDSPGYGTQPIAAGPRGHLFVAPPDAGILDEIASDGTLARIGPGLPRVITPSEFEPAALAVGPHGHLLAGGPAGLWEIVLGPACTVPDLRARLTAAAARRIRAAGCSPRVLVRGGRPSRARVLRQDPAPGTVVAPATRVTVVAGALPRGCYFPDGAHVIVRNAVAQIATRTLRVPDQDDAHRLREGWWGCLPAVGTVRRLAQITSVQAGEGGASVGRFELSGTHVAFTSFVADGHYGRSSTEIVSRDLATERDPTVLSAGTSDDFGPYYILMAFVLNADGAVAWLGMKDAVAQLQVGSPGHGQRTLAFARPGDITDVTIDSVTVSWRQAGSTRTAPVAP